MPIKVSDREWQRMDDVVKQHHKVVTKRQLVEGYPKKCTIHANRMTKKDGTCKWHAICGDEKKCVAQRPR